MIKKAVQTTELQYFEVSSTTLTTMHNLKTNFDKFLSLTNKHLSNYLHPSGNVKP